MKGTQPWWCFSRFSVVASSLINNEGSECHLSQGEHRSPAAAAVESISSVRRFDCGAAGRHSSNTHWGLLSHKPLLPFSLSTVVRRNCTRSHTRSSSRLWLLSMFSFFFSSFFCKICNCALQGASLTMSCVVGDCYHTHTSLKALILRLAEGSHKSFGKTKSVFSPGADNPV